MNNNAEGRTRQKKSINMHGMSYGLRVTKMDDYVEGFARNVLACSGRTATPRVVLSKTKS